MSDTRKLGFSELIQIFTQHEEFRGVFWLGPDGYPCAIKPPVPLPCEGLAAFSEVGPGFSPDCTEDGPILSEYLGKRGLTVSAEDAARGVVAAAHVNGTLEYTFMPPALREWVDS